MTFSFEKIITFTLRFFNLQNFYSNFFQEQDDKNDHLILL